MEKAKIFLNHINDNYQTLKDRFRRFCFDKSYKWDEDIFSNTILSCYETITKKGLQDTSPLGIENYFFMSFKFNVMRDKLYSRNKARDRNVTDINGAYENYCNNNLKTAEEKIANDLFNDFAITYILKEVEKNFDVVSFYLYRLKSLTPKMTYKKLTTITKFKSVRQKVCNVKRWVKNNIKIGDIRKAFYREYGDIIQ